MIQGMITGIKRFEIHDGPGIRTTVFLKGCPLRCIWCHNPENISPFPQLMFYQERCIRCGKCVQLCKCHQIGTEGHTILRQYCGRCGLCAGSCPSKALQMRGYQTTAENLADELAEDMMFFTASGGGVTISGGEPLMQPQFTEELLKLLNKKQIHTALDTSLYAPAEVVKAVSAYTSLFLVDIKAMDSQVHRRYTGVPNEHILDNIRMLDCLGGAMEFRIPCIAECNMDQMDRIAAFLCGLEHPYPVRLLPYHDYGNSKAHALGMQEVSLSVPEAEQMHRTLQKFRNLGIHAVCNGVE